MFNGTHDQQDQAMMEALQRRYPDMGFTCREKEGNVHTVQADDGTEFPTWTAPAKKGEYQVMEYYLEEWLAAQGFYNQMESELESRGYAYEYHSYNHYDRHFQPLLGGLDSPDQVEKAVDALNWIKGRFDEYYADFHESTGCPAPVYYYHVTYQLDGEDCFVMVNLSMREDDYWNFDFPYDDYESVLKDAIARVEAPSTPSPG